MKKNNILKRFRDDKRGSAYVMAALAVVPMFGMMSLAIDYTNHDRIRTDLETAAETVALHIAKRVALDPNRPASEFVTEGKSIFASLVNIPITYDKFDVDTSTGKVQIVAKTEVSTYFMHMFGHDTLTAETKTEARFGRLNVDVAIAVDNSGSMSYGITDGNGGSIKKIDAAKKAAKLLVKTAAASVEDLSNTNLRFSVVPWHSHVSLPDSELRTGAADGAPVDQGTWAPWIDWDGRSEGHFTYLAPYRTNSGSNYGEMFFDMNGGDGWDKYDPEKLAALLPKEPDGGGVDLNALKAKTRGGDPIGIVTRRDVFENTNTAFNGCFEHRYGDYRYSFNPPTVSTMTDPAQDPQFNGDSLYVPNMAPDERDGWGGRNDYLADTGGDSNSASLSGEKARVMNSAKYVNLSSDDLDADSYDNPNGSCNTAKVLPLNDDVKGIVDESDPAGDIKKAIDDMDANGFTDQSIGLEWAMNSLTPWAPLPQGGEFADTQKILVFMTDGFNETRNKTYYANSYMSFQYPRDDVWDSTGAEITGNQIDKQINDATKRYCDLIRARGVKIYYIYFGTPNDDARDIKDHCASTPESAIEATSSAELEAAFEKIGDDIGRLRLTHYQE